MIGDKETVHISWCHGGQVDASFAFSLMDIIRMFPTHVGSYNAIQGIGLLSKSRNVGVKYFLDNTNDDWMFMVDSDQYITPDAFAKLINAADSQEVPFVSGLYFAAYWPKPNELEPVPLIYVNKGEAGVLPYYDYPKDSLVEVYAAGTGCMLIHRSVLEKLRELGAEISGKDWAWFQDGPIEAGKWLSEDLLFCDRVQRAGIKIHAHTGAVMPHHKSMWVTESHYDDWLKKQDLT